MALKGKPYNIVMYSHDTYGLGHIRRTLAIASQIRNPSTNILILTGSSIAGTVYGRSGTADTAGEDLSKVRLF
jgi:predicted glycosyltransferase